MITPTSTCLASVPAGVLPAKCIYAILRNSLGQRYEVMASLPCICPPADCCCVDYSRLLFNCSRLSLTVIRLCVTCTVVMECFRDQRLLPTRFFIINASEVSKVSTAEHTCRRCER